MKTFLIGLLALLSTHDAFAAVSSCRFKNASGTFEFTATTSSAKMFSENPFRTCLAIQNRGSTSVYVRYDQAHSGTEGIVILAGQYQDFPVVPTNSIYIESASSTDLVEGFEGQ